MAETLSSLADLKETALAPAVAEAPVHVQKLDKQGRAYATGKRKNAVARVWIKPGKGQATVNGKALDVYFARPVLRMILNQPLPTEERGLPHPRFARRRAQEVRPRQGAPQLPVLQALRRDESARIRKGRLRPPFLFDGSRQAEALDATTTKRHLSRAMIAIRLRRR
jgi:hypothetical protein